jgi:aspartate/methionine/tyrosine aminotransferase
MELFFGLYQHNTFSRAQITDFLAAVHDVRSDLMRLEGPQKLSSLMDRVSGSPTAAMAARAAELKAQGKDIVSTLGVGEPDYPPPPCVAPAIADALAHGRHRYTVSMGIPELRQAICDDLKTRKGVSYTPAQVICSTGGKQALFQAIMATVEAGDEVVLPTPCWVSYTEMVKLAGATPVFLPRVQTSQFQLTESMLLEKMSPNTKAIIICNPCNPTGVPYTRASLEAVAAVVARPEFARTLVISDEIYEGMVYEGEEHICFAALPGMFDKTVIINGFSKRFAMTGLRLGYGAAPTEIIKATNVLQTQITTCPASIIQWAGVAALKDTPPSWEEGNMEILRTRRDLICSALETIPGIKYVRPSAAFYVLANVEDLCGTAETPDSDAFALQLLDAGLSLVSGAAFEAPGHVRIAFAASTEELKEAMARLKAFCERLHARKMADGK